MVDELCHNWICDLVNLCIVEIFRMLWLCGLMYMYIGGFCWWLWIFGLDSNYVFYLLVLIHLVNIFDDNYFDNNDEVRFVYVCVCVCVCIYIYIYIYIFCTVYVDYDWCEANPQWFWPPTCLYEWVDGVHD